MSKFKIAMLQLQAEGFDQEANLLHGVKACQAARELGADLALFPEMWNIGYTFFEEGQSGAIEHWKAQAIDAQAPFCRRFQDLAAELGLAIGLTYLERWPGGPRNSFSLFDRFGRIVLTYAKVHTCVFDVEKHLTPGDGFPVADLDTQYGPVRVGAMICYDREFPESARLLMLQGVEVILVPNACELEINRMSQLRGRAYENQCAIFTTNYPGPTANGHSIAFDGIAFGEGEVSRDMRLVEAGEEEGVYLASLDLDALRRYRAVEGGGGAYRRPEMYRKLGE